MPTPIAARRRLVVALFVVFGACSVPRPEVPAPRGGASGAPALRVGVTADRPPYVLRRQGRLVGLEIDMAQRLAQALERRLVIVELAWEQQIPVLQDGRTDVIMSGMTVTEARSVQVAFAEPYLHSGLALLMRRADRPLYPTLAAVTERTVIGVVAGTTSERYAREHFDRSSLQVYPAPGDAVTELTQSRIDLVLADLAIVVWMVSRNEGELAALRHKIGDEPLAWAFRREDGALRAAANAVLARWRSDGTLAALTQRWLP
jgi:polar amino acid transport system substrate-binding protein